MTPKQDTTATKRRAEAERPNAAAAEAPPDAATVAARRRLVLGAVAAVGAVAMAGAVWLTVASPGGESGGHDRDHRRASGPGEATVQRPVGAPQLVRLSGRAGGRVRLAVSADVPAAGAPRRLPAVPAGRAVTLDFALPRTVDGRSEPRLVARRLSGGSGASAGAASAPVPLAPAETFLFNRRSGQVIVPDASAGGGAAAAGSHAHEPGRGLSQTIPGGGWSFTTQLPAGAGETALDPTGRYLAAAYPRAGRVELLDLLRHERAGAIAGLGRPARLRFSPRGDRLWVADEARGRLTLVHVASRRALAMVAVGAGRQAVAFGPSGTALVTARGAGRATLLDARTGRIRATAAVAEPVDVVAAGGRFAVAGRDGTVTVMGVAGRALRAERRISLGPGTALSALGVAPDGRTAVALDTATDALAIVDLASGRVRRRVEAGADPSSVVFLDRFAIVRNAGSGELTWVDLDDPSKSNDLPVGPRAAAAIALSADGRSVLATLPGERQVASLHVMMGRPMVMDGLVNAIAADVAASVANELQADGPRRLEQRAVFERPGRYELDLRLADGSRARFVLPVADSGRRALRVAAETRRLRAAPGEQVRVRFRVTGPAPADAQVLALRSSAGAIEQLRAPARPVGAGILEAVLTPRTVGSYRVSLQSESRSLTSDARSGAALRVGAPPGG